jgi:hypothetical protein
MRLPAPLPDRVMTPSLEWLPPEVAALAALYVEPESAGQFMPPGKRTTSWGPPHWAVYSTLWCEVWGSRKDRIHHASTTLLPAAHLHIESTPFGLGCGVCRWSNSVILSLNPIRLFVRTPSDAAAYYCAIHNAVNIKFNVNPANDALPRKPIYHYDTAKRTSFPCRHPCSHCLSLSSSSSSSPSPSSSSSSSPAAVSVSSPYQKAKGVLETEEHMVTSADQELEARFVDLLFGMLYHVAAHFPDLHRGTPFVRRHRLRMRMLLAQWCHILPGEWSLRSSLTAVFGLGPEFSRVCHDPGTRLSTLDEWASKNVSDEDPTWPTAWHVFKRLRHCEVALFEKLGLVLPAFDARTRCVLGAVVSSSIPLRIGAPKKAEETLENTNELLAIMTFRSLL